MDGTGRERSELQTFCCRKMYFCKDMVVLMVYCASLSSIAQKNCKTQLCYFTLKLTKSSCTCIMSPVEASHKFGISKFVYEDKRKSL